MNQNAIDDAINWLRDDAASAREDDPTVGIFANDDVAQIFDYLADNLNGILEGKPLPPVSFR